MFLRRFLFTLSLAEILVWLSAQQSTSAEDLDSWVRKYWEMAIPTLPCASSITLLGREHFPSSHFEPERVDHRLYADWAVKMARLTYDRLQAREDPRSIFETLGTNRYELQEELQRSGAGEQWPGGVPDQCFGRFRWSKIGGVYTCGWSSEMADQENICHPLYNIAISARFVTGRIRVSKRSDLPKSCDVRQIRYTGLNGKRYNSTQIEHFHGEQSCNIVHPTPGTAKKIFLDSLHRLRLLQRPTNGHRAIDLILQSYYGYVQATPYYRGSSSIARSFWAGLGAFYLSNILFLPEGFDYLAMETSQTDFLRSTKPIFGNICSPKM